MKLKFLTVLLTFSILSMAQEIQKMEPPFWWSDMYHTDLQVLFYGNNFAQYDVKVNKGVILNQIKTENPNYLFVNWDTKNLTAGIYHFDFYKDGVKVFSKDYELKNRKVNSRFRKSFGAADAIYLIMPDRFANGNPDNDNHPEMAEKVNRSFDGGRHGGDIAGIIKNLDYIQDLGITALWSTPLLEDNEPVYSYHHYAQSDYYKTDPRYGTNEDYVKLSDELHQRKMKLIMDYVTNHWGSKHWMIKDLPSADWIHQWNNAENGFQRSNYRMTTQFDKNAATVDSEGCMDGWFDTTMPDMNQSNTLLLQYMIQNAIWWVEYADLDGFRVDTYSYNDKTGIAAWSKAILDEYPNFNIVGEVWMHDQAQISYWQKDSPIGALQSYNSYLPSVMDFTLQDAINQMFNEDKLYWDNGMQRAYDNFANDFLYANPMNLMVFGGNHDITRINNIFGSDVRKYKLLITLLTTMRGYPQLYYGDEIGMTGDKNKGDGFIREDFPGGWKNDAKNAFNQQGRTDQQEEYHSFTKKLLQWRKQARVIHEGKFLQFVPLDNLYVYFRYTDHESVMTIINNSDKTQKLNWERFKQGWNGYQFGTDIVSDKTIRINDEIHLPAKSSMILELKK